MLKGMSEAQGMEGWQQSKIPKAADYIGSYIPFRLRYKI